MEIIFASAYELEISQAVSDVFDSMLGCHAERRGSSPDQIAAAVFFAGLWQGAIPLECGRDETLASPFKFDAHRSIRVNDDDARDAMGEIVNIIGGNLNRYSRTV